MTAKNVDVKYSLVKQTKVSGQYSKNNGSSIQINRENSLPVMAGDLAVIKMVHVPNG